MGEHRGAEIHLQPMEEPVPEQLQRESKRVALVGAWYPARVNPLQIPTFERSVALRGSPPGDVRACEEQIFPFTVKFNDMSSSYRNCRSRLSAACSKNKRPESDPIHNSMNQEHSQQDPRNFFNEGQGVQEQRDEVNCLMTTKSRSELVEKEIQ
ncbi:hypothetical protein BTVI_125762 [Pitangus sulphuratus]|nr:hypothetical protein BTVI_125762 [Pitangus sulphuratus]